MKKITALLLCLLSSSVFSQTQIITDNNDSAAQLLSNNVTNLRVGFVDFRRIMSTVPQLKEIQNQLDNEFKQQQQELVDLQKELSQLEKNAGSISSDEDYNKMEQALISKRREVSKKDTTLRDNYSVRRNEEITKLQRKVLDNILEIAKSENYDVILNDTGVIYVSPKADLTALVIQKMNNESVNESPINHTARETQ